MCCDPNDTGNVTALLIDNRPQILMCTLGAVTLEEKFNEIKDIATVRDKRKRPCEKGQCDKDCIDFRPQGPGRAPDICMIP